MQKRAPTIVAVIIGLALTLYGGHLFFNIKAGHHQAVGSENQQVIQLGLPNKQMISIEPAWTLTKQAAALDLPTRNPGTVRIGPALSIEACKLQDDMGHFFIAGIIVEDQSKNIEEKTIFISNDQPLLVEAGYAHPAHSDLAIN